MTCGAISNFARARGGWPNGLMPRTFAGNNAGPNWTVSGTAGSSTEMKTRFTIDGSPELEDRLERLCSAAQRWGHGTEIPPKDIATVVLGGGYGRGEGGVLRTEAGEQPYNDLEFYVFCRGHRLWQEHRYGTRLHDLGGMPVG